MLEDWTQFEEPQQEPNAVPGMEVVPVAKRGGAVPDVKQQAEEPGQHRTTRTEPDMEVLQVAKSDEVAAEKVRLRDPWFHGDGSNYVKPHRDYLCHRLNPCIPSI